MQNKTVRTWKTSKIRLYWERGEFLVEGGRKIIRDACNSIHGVSAYPMVLEFLEISNSRSCSDFFEFFFFGTGNVLEKIQFSRLVLELFLNSELLTTNFLGRNISGCPLFGSSICDKISFQFCPRLP